MPLCAQSLSLHSDEDDVSFDLHVNVRVQVRVTGLNCQWSECGPENRAGVALLPVGQKCFIVHNYRKLRDLLPFPKSVWPHGVVH